MGMTSKVLLLYAALMLAGLLVSHVVSLDDARTLRGVGVWAKPMKFMAATALFAATTVWLTRLASTSFEHGASFKKIGALLIVTSAFEVAYITYQGYQGTASHYNVADPVSAAMFGLMAIAAVGLTGSQAWLAYGLYRESQFVQRSLVQWGVISGLLVTFVLATVSGFMLGGNQPPAGQGLPVVGWHVHQDIRPAHFLGVHAQQLLPLWGLLLHRVQPKQGAAWLGGGVVAYVVLWLLLSLGATGVFG
jgi:hypothetical protein